MAQRDRFWISIDNRATWNEVSLDAWCDMERQCGFRGGRPATAGFSSGTIYGHMHYAWSEQDQKCDFGPCEKVTRG